MSYRIFRPSYVIEELGELGLIPDGGITNIGGVFGSTFTVGGKPLLFADGTSTGPGGGGIVLQTTYDNAQTGVLVLSSGKNFVLQAGNGGGLTVNAGTGNVSITGDLNVSGLVNGINLLTLSAHLDALVTPAKHSAEQISADTAGLTNVSGSNVQQVIESIDSRLSAVGAGNAQGFEYVQILPAIVWTITHSSNTRRVQVTVWDETDNMTFADTVSIVDPNTVRIVFNTPAAGRAILMLF